MGGRDIFLSYSTKDDAIARLACERLEQADYSSKRVLSESFVSPPTVTAESQ
jgi:hypothetical protein